MTFMNRCFFCCLLLLLGGCGAALENEADAGNAGDPLVAFNDFPDSLFNSIYWDQPLAEAQSNLHAKGFELIDSSGAFNYYNPGDSTQVIIPESRKIQSLKLLLYSKGYRSQKKRLLDGFTLFATSASQSPEFSVFDYDLGFVDFKLTVFMQEDFIRLNFELQRRQ
jgi:hypothetical protein